MRHRVNITDATSAPTLGGFNLLQSRDVYKELCDTRVATQDARDALKALGDSMKDIAATMSDIRESIQKNNEIMLEAVKKMGDAEVKVQNLTDKGEEVINVTAEFIKVHYLPIEGAISPQIKF